MSTKPILYYDQRSPPCRAVLLVAAEIGVDLDLRLINCANGDNLSAEFLKINPQHTIPVLDDNGVIIVDSHVICGYLADQYSKNDHLYPRDLVKRCQVQTRLYFNCGHLFPRICNLFQPVIFAGFDEFPEDKIKYIQSAYGAMDNYLREQPYVCGQHLTIADLCCIATLSTVDDIAPIDKDTYPRLLDWMNRMAALPYYAEANLEGATTLKKFIVAKVEMNRKAKFA